MTMILYEADILGMKNHSKTLIGLLSQERQTKIQRYRNQDDQLRSLTAGLLLYRAFGRRSTQICQNEFGKPYLEGGPFFNLSHSGQRVILLVDSLSPVGCDIQLHENVHPNLIAKHLFHPSEYELWKNSPHEKQTSLFYRLWTLKESYLKMLGKGFSLSPKRFGFELTPSIRLLEMPEMSKESANPFFHILEEDEYSLALCSQSNPNNFKREAVSPRLFL